MAYRNNRRSNKPTAFMVPREDKNGKTYWSGTMDLGNGKAIKLTMFEIDANKAQFAVSGTKKTYKQRSTRDRW